MVPDEGCGGVSVGIEVEVGVLGEQDGWWGEVSIFDFSGLERYILRVLLSGETAVILMLQVFFLTL